MVMVEDEEETDEDKDEDTDEDSTHRRFTRRKPTRENERLAGWQLVVISKQWRG